MVSKSTKIQIKEIEQDCLKLKKQRQLTEFGKGELHIINLIKKDLSKKEKYSINDLKKYPNESRTDITNLMIANELHNLCQTIK